MVDHKFHRLQDASFGTTGSMGIDDDANPFIPHLESQPNPFLPVALDDVKRPDHGAGAPAASDTSDAAAPSATTSSNQPAVAGPAVIHSMTTLTTATSNVVSTSDAAPLVTDLSAAGSFTIIPSFDTSVTSSPDAGNYESAVNSAISYLESVITNSMTITIGFGYGEVGGNNGSAGTPLSPNSGAESSTPGYNFSYGAVYDAIQATDTTSVVQRDAAALLPPADPTNGATINVTVAEASALGLSNGFSGFSGNIGLSLGTNGYGYTWSQSGTIAPDTLDAVGVFEHEITEVLGRADTGGANNTYNPLDFFRYTSADGGGGDPIGSAAGTIDQPFASTYDAAANSYFSYDGKSVTLQYDSPSAVSAGEDVADWNQPTVGADSFDGASTYGVSNPVSTTDLQELNVLGYDEVAQVTCYLAGTSILTDRGDVAVQDLSIGDLVMTVSGTFRPIKWLGHRQIDLMRHPDPSLVRPIRIRANAISDGRPHRDLLISPDHAILLDDLLIPARLLINGASIVPEVTTPRVVYYHVELDNHDILYAEGLPAESYLDTGNRAMFENGDGPVSLHPNFDGGQAAREAGSCAPFATTPNLVKPVWDSLATRAAMIGWPVQPQAALTDDPAPYLLVGTRRIEPSLAGNGLYTFVVPPGGQPVRLMSRAARPCDDRPWIEDRRLLGLRIRGLTWRDGQTHQQIAMDDTALRLGWWGVETDGGSPSRWTDGDAGIPTLGAGILDVRLAEAMRYPIDAQCAPDQAIRRQAAGATAKSRSAVEGGTAA